MSGFEHYAEDITRLEQEIIRKGIALNINWDDPVEVELLAQEALTHAQDLAHRAAVNPADRLQLARVELFGLAALMLKTMAETANEGFLTHGGPVWKTFARALWKAKRINA